jgi:hypothetical protein
MLLGGSKLRRVMSWYLGYGAGSLVRAPIYFWAGAVFNGTRFFCGLVLEGWWICIVVYDGRGRDFGG